MDRQTILNLDLNIPSRVSKYKLELFLEDTPLEGLADTFVRVERNLLINAVYLLAHAIHESNFGRSRIAREKNNLYGFMAYDVDPYGSAARFESFKHSIEYCSAYIKKHYLTPGGSYYNGSTLKGVNVKYATDPKWADKVATWMQRIYDFLSRKTDYEGHWAEADIVEAISLGFVAGHSDGTVRPNEVSTRAEVIAMMMRMYRKLKGGS